MSRADTSHGACSDTQGSAVAVPVPEPHRHAPSRWSLSCPGTSGPLTHHRDESVATQCRLAAFASRQAWPPLNLVVTADPQANWMAQTRPSRTAMRRSA